MLQKEHYLRSQNCVSIVIITYRVSLGLPDQLDVHRFSSSAGSSYNETEVIGSTLSVQRKAFLVPVMGSTPTPSGLCLNAAPLLHQGEPSKGICIALRAQLKRHKHRKKKVTNYNDLLPMGVGGQ